MAHDRNRICSCLMDALPVVACLVIAAFVLSLIIGLPISLSTANRTQVTVTLVDARGLDVDEQTRTAPVEFDVAIGLSHLPRELAVAHDGGDLTISYAGVQLAHGPVSKFYVAGGPKRVEATTAMASAGKDQAPLSQMFRDHLWVDQQMDGEALFDVALTFYDVNVTTGETTREYHSCKVGFALHGKDNKPTKCGQPGHVLHRR